MNRGAAALAIAALTITSLTVAASPEPTDVLTRSLDDVPRALDPQLVTDIPAMRVLDDLFEGLVTVSEDGRVAPGVASSWEHSADGLTWTFHLRADARWSDGTPVLAGDFIYSWRREVDPHTAAQYAEALAPLRNAMEIVRGQKPTQSLGVEAADPHTLLLHLVAPTPYLLDLLDQWCMYPVPRQAIEAHGEHWTDPDHLVSNGAFKLRANAFGGRITLVANPYYWDAARTRLSTVIYYALPDRSQTVARFLAGDLQFADSFAAGQTPWLRSRLGAQVVTSPWFGTYELGLSFKIAPFAGNHALREALTLAIDRGALTHYLKYDVYQPAYTLMPALPDYQPPQPAWAHWTQAQRETLAQQRYREAGYSAAHPLRIDISAPLQGPDDRHFYEAVAAMWHAVLGAEVGVDNMEFKVLVQRRELQSLPLFHDAWVGDFPDPINFLDRFYGGNEINNAGYSNPQFDALLNRAALEPDASKRLSELADAERLLDADVAYIPLYYYATRHLVKPDVRGWQPNIVDRNLSRYMYRVPVDSQRP